MDKHVENALAALGGKKIGTGPVEAEIETSGDAVEDLGALVGTNEGVPQELLSLARSAALAADASREAGAKAKALKGELDEAMKAASVTEIAMPDRDPIAYKTTSAKAKTLKALKEKMIEEATKALAGSGAPPDTKAVDAAKAKAQAAAKTAWDEFWVRFPTLPSTSLDIPKPKPPAEPEPDLE